MALKLEFSILTGVMTSVVVYGVYQNALPSVADTRSLQASNSDLERSERVASWTGASVVAGVSLIARDPTIFIIGGASLVAMAWTHRHANAVQPATGTTAGVTLPKISQSESPASYSAPAAPAYEATF